MCPSWTVLVAEWIMFLPVDVSGEKEKVKYEQDSGTHPTSQLNRRNTSSLSLVRWLWFAIH